MLRSLMALLEAAKSTAPAAGRMSDWVMSLNVSMIGILSAAISMSSNTAMTSSTHGCSRAFHGSDRVRRSV